MVNAGRSRSGVIGVGMAGSVHAHAVHRAGGVLAAVAGSSPQSSRTACERLNATRATTAEDIIDADDVDVVHVCAPNDLHHDLALAALAAGKHVVCEKPLATTLKDAQECFNLFVADVYAAIRTGEVPDGLGTFVDGLRAAHINAAVLASIAGGDWVQVPPIPGLAAARGAGSGSRHVQ